MKNLVYQIYNNLVQFISVSLTCTKRITYKGILPKFALVLCCTRRKNEEKKS